MQGPEPIQPDPDNAEGQSQGQPQDELADLLPAYAFGFTDPAEEQYIKATLAHHPEAARELADYAELAQAMLFSAPVVPAPAHLRERIEAALAEGERHAERPAPVAAPVTTPPRRRSWLARLWEPALVTAALALLALDVYWYLENQTLQATNRELAAQVERQNQALMLLLESQPQQIVLPAAEETSTAHATVLWQPDAPIAVLQAEGFPPLTEDKVYQLWLLKDGDRTSAGLFTVDETGKGALVFETPLPIDQWDVIGVTPEPAGGSPGPTSPPVVRLQF